MLPISIVIITKNEAHIIARSLSMARRITHDIIVVDSGSTDGTLQIALEAGCRVYQKKWDGYAANKNKGIELAAHDWILSIDADEIPDNDLINHLHRVNLYNPKVVYDIKFQSYFGDKRIRFGKWGRDHHIRLFNRRYIKWSDSPVHETLEIPGYISRKKLNGCLHHYSVKNAAHLHAKLINYARLSARKYDEDGKRSTFTKLYLSPAFNFIKNYVFYLGFLDGSPGWLIAVYTLKHTWLKYDLLQKLELQKAPANSVTLFIDEPALADY